jgi:hypothetical protein
MPWCHSYQGSSSPDCPYPPGQKSHCVRCATVRLGIGIGLGIATGPATDSVMGAVPVAKAGVGSAMNDTTQELGGALGVAILGTVANRDFLDQINRLSIQNILPSDVYELIKSGIVGAHQFAAYIPFPQIQRADNDESGVKPCGPGHRHRWQGSSQRL